MHWTFSAATLQILFMLKQQHYTLTNVKKVKSQSTTPLRWHQQKEFMKTGWLYFNKGPRVKGSIKKSFLIVVYSNCYSLIWYLIFFYMLRYFVIIFLPSFVSCAYTTYILLFYFMCVSNELVFNFDNIFFFMCKHQVHLDFMFKYLSVYSQNILFTFLCGCYCYFMNDKLHDAEFGERSLRDIYACYHMFCFCCSVTWDLWQKMTFHVFARIQNITIHSILLYGSMDNCFFLLWLWHEL